MSLEAKWTLVTRDELRRMYAPPKYEYLSGCCRDTMTTWELIGRDETQMRCNSCGAVVVRTARLTEGERASKPSLVPEGDTE